MHTRTISQRRFWLKPGLRVGVLSVATCLSFSGCVGSSLDSLDQRVAEMIVERQRLSLGEEGVSDASARLPEHSFSSSLYDQQPATNNPTAADLPARPADDSEGAGGQADPPVTLDPIELDLPGLLAYAIENAPEYRSEKEALFLSTLSLIIERHLWGPRFFNTLSSNISGTPEAGDFDTALSLINDFTVTQRLPNGGDISVSALVNYTNLLQRSSLNSSPRDIQSSSINVALDLPLLRGSGQVAREDLIQAERDLIYAVRDFERFRREFFVDISNIYFGLIQQQQNILNQEQQIEGLNRLLAEQQAFLKAEEIAGFEVNDTEAQVLFGQSALASVRDNYVSSLDSLKLTVGMPVSQPLVITMSELQVPSPALNVAESIKIGQAARLDLQTTADQVDDARRSVRIARDNLRGDLDLNASLTLNSDQDRNVDGFDFELSDSDYNVGLAYSAPLDRTIELAGYRSSLVSLEAAERNHRVQRDQAALQIRAASREIERATLTLDLQVRNVGLAERRLENIKILRRRGEVPPRRLIEAEEDLLDARNSRDEAQADLQTSVLNYLLQTGQMRVDPQGRWLVPGTLTPRTDLPSDDTEAESLGNLPDVESEPPAGALDQE